MELHSQEELEMFCAELGEARRVWEMIYSILRFDAVFCLKESLFMSNVHKYGVYGYTAKDYMR